MAKAALKTTETEAEVQAFIDKISDDQQRADANWIIDAMTRLSGHPPKMWGPSIIGFGRYHYKYDSGREGEMCRIGFSPRKGQTVLYLVDGFPHHADLMARLGKHKTGKSCLYVKRLSDVDLDVVEQLVAASLAYMAAHYPQDA